MARNEEKAMGLLNRWTSFKAELKLGSSERRRPILARECKNLSEAMDHRRSLVREITQKITEIQNAGLGEHRLRELNDEINKLLREKYHWEKQIQALGGPSLMDKGADRGEYKYFGAAKDLPQVREMLNKPTVKKHTKRKREEIMANITYKYFESIEDESQDSSGLFEAERQEEDRIRAKRKDDLGLSETTEIAKREKREKLNPSEFERLLLKTAHYADLAFLTPEQKEELNTSKAMERLIVERKKKELLSKYLT